MRHPLPTTLNSGLVGCGVCHLLVPAPEPAGSAHCSRAAARHCTAASPTA